MPAATMNRVVAVTTGLIFITYIYLLSTKRGNINGSSVMLVAPILCLFPLHYNDSKEEYMSLASNATPPSSAEPIFRPLSVMPSTLTST
ncbi:hypothetical protein F4778DRAFT_763300 [Xylariomycetidae sp. FL2044]|nr:hypothetical protein F4778DRAFT_763300 [Xylariomycetidae sp. FL2044]